MKIILFIFLAILMLINLSLWFLYNYTDTINDELKIEKSEALQQLHESIMRALDPYLESEATLDMLYSPPKVDEISLSWIRKYREKWSFEKFYPHITLGIGRTNQQDVVISFVASELALCHLGNYCTCRKILYSSSLGKAQGTIN